MKFLVLAPSLLFILINCQPRMALVECGESKVSNRDHFCIQPNYIEGCVEYESKNKCFKCQPGYEVNKNGGCDGQQFLPKKDKLVGCLRRDNTDFSQCNNCANGYIRRNGKCIKGVKDCAKYSSNNTCKQCQKDYTLVLNQCRYNVMLGCKKINPDHECQACEQPFTLNGSSCFIENCKTFNDYGCVTCQCGYFLLPNRTCKMFQQGCLRYEKGKCINCVEHYKLKGGICQIEGCVQYKDHLCRQCKPPYKSEHGGCSFQNCIDWMNDMCLSCREGFRNENGCVQVEPSDIDNIFCLQFTLVYKRAMAMIPSLYERNQEATVYAGNLDAKVNQNILWELFIQCGPVVNVHIPRDKISNQHQGFGFIEFKSQEDADYSIKIMHMIKLYGKPIKVNKASQDKRAQDVGANLFIGNLDPQVDQKILYDTFSNFGTIVSTKINRDPEDGTSKGHGFVSYDNFNSSDLAISQMNGQFFSGRQVRVEYAVKKDAKGAEKHGTFAQRLLAQNKPNSSSKMPPLLLHNPPAPFVSANDKFSKTSAPPQIPLAKGGITPNLLPPPKPLLGQLNSSIPNIKLPSMPPLPNLPNLPNLPPPPSIN